jgi:hypothetical protein
MKKTPQEFKRKEVKELFSKVLGESKISFAPLAINISESLENDFTVVNILFSEKLSQSTNTDFGISEFQHQSRSMIYSSFISTLQAFQFYINCEICFHKIKLALEDAKTRNRGDIIQSCMLDLSKLTGVNTYAKEKN